MEPGSIIAFLFVFGLIVFALRNNDRGRPPDIDASWQPAAPPVAVPGPSGFHRLVKWALALWAIAYPVVSCSPLFATGTDSGGAAAVGGFASLVVGATLFGPWVVGLLVLGVLWLVTK